MTFVGGPFMRGVIVGWVPPSLPPLHKRPPLIIASKCPCPYANLISEAFRIDFVDKSMFLRSTTKPPILVVLTNNHISEAFRIDCVSKSMLLRSKTKPLFVSIRGRFDQISFFMRGEIMPPSKLIVTTYFSPKCFFIGGVNYESGRSNQKSSFMRGVIVPPSKLIVNTCFFPQGVFLLGGYY